MHFGPKIATDGCVASIDGSDNGSFEVLIVAGGGGGGMDMGGGGGGGGVLYFPAMQLDPGTAYTVTVGIGGYGAPAGNGGFRTDGAGPQPSGHQFTISATQGGNSVFGSFTAIGGGFGASSYYGYLPNSGIGGTGGSGGGCSAYTHGGERYVDGTNGSTANNTPGQGFPGGNSGNPTTGADDHYSGGGGGAAGRGTSGPGHAGPNGTRGNGGNGIENSILGTSYFWAGGGGGSGYSGDGGNGGVGGSGGGSASNGNIGSAGAGGINVGSNGSAGNNAPGGNAGANTGSGGGGGSHYNSNNKGGEGGSGIVVVAYKGPQRATGGTIDTTSRPGFTLHKYTSTGNSTFTPYAVDTAGNTNHCTFNGNAYLTKDGGNGGVFVFDGTGDYLTNPSFLAHQQSTGTIMAWAYPTAIVSDYYLLGAGGSTTYGATRAIRINGNNWSCVTYGSSTEDYNGIVAATTNIWQHAAFVWNGTTINFYLNGTLYSVTRSGMINPTSTTFSIGAPPWSLSISNWPGKIACARVYNRSLSTTEIQSIFNNTRKRFNV